MEEALHIIISGGGTGGHIFPAVSIANAVKAKRPDAKILFVGAEGRMEMQRVPAVGYEIVGLPVCGFDRKNLLKNIRVLYKLFQSQQKARRVINNFQPHVAVGVGGYASGPTLNMAGKMGIPTLLQEQNSYAGVTNKLLAKRARTICVAYENMDRFFPADKIILTGNPVRQGLLDHKKNRAEAIKAFRLNPEKKTLLVIGGSLGARTLNESILASLEELEKANLQVIWQCGKYYYKSARHSLESKGSYPNICLTDFISNMDEAYSAADLIVSRAGAGSISELCLLGKAVILVPSPNVAEDHQTKNALALVDKEAALYVKDAESVAKLVPTVLSTISDDALLAKLRTNILKLAFHHSAEIIADEVIKLAEETQRKR